MGKNDIIAGIDIGSTHVRVVVGQVHDNGQVQAIGVGESPARGISKGAIVDLEETVTSLSEALEHAERMIGTPLSRAVVGVNSPNCKVVTSQGVVAVSKPNGEVTQADVDRADEQSQAVAAAPNYEILHVLPKFYHVDTQQNIKDPVGMTGIKLEAHTQVILALSSQVKQLNKALYRTQLEVDGLVFAPLAAAEVALTKRQKDLGCALVNLGAWTTSVAVFEDSELLHAAVLPVGSDHITGDLAIGCRVDVDVADRLKVEQGLTPSKSISKRDEVDLAKYSTEEIPRSPFSKKEVSEIIEARLEEIFSLVNEELQKAGRASKLPGGVILTGGGSKLKGVVEFAKDIFKLPVFLSSTERIATPIDKVKDPQFATALGLVHFADADSGESSFFQRFRLSDGPVGSVLKRLKDLVS